MPEKKKTPGVVTFAGVILILVGAWSVVGGICGANPLISALTAPGNMPAGAKVNIQDAAEVHRFLAKEAPGYLMVALIAIGLDMLLGLGQIGSAIGVTKLSSGARTMAISFTVAKLLLSLGNMGYWVVFVMGPQESMMKANAPAAAQAPFDVAAFMSTFMIVIMAVALFIQLVIAAVIIFLLNTQSAKAAFAGVPAKPAADESDSDEEEEERPRRRSRRDVDDDEADDERPRRRPRRDDDD